MKNKISKYIDGEKLHRDMQARYENLHNLILRDYGGNTEVLENKWLELKFWKESLERSVYDTKEDSNETTEL